MTPPPITGTTPPAIDCPKSLCNDYKEGNFEMSSHPNYFLQCIGGEAYCRACFPLHLFFSQKCNQCLYNKDDDCVTTSEWLPATTFQCPDECPNKGPTYTGNIADPTQSRQYVACFEGATVGCVACPGNLEFNESENACLYEGKYITEPTKEE